MGSLNDWRDEVLAAVKPIASWLISHTIIALLMLGFFRLLEGVVGILWPSSKVFLGWIDITQLIDIADLTVLVIFLVAGVVKFGSVAYDNIWK